MIKETLLALIQTEEIEEIKKLVDENIDYATLNLDKQKSLIHHAAKLGSLDLVRFLINKKPELLDLTDTLGQTPILWSAAYGHENIVDYLANIGADINRPSTDNGDNYAPIHWASERGYQNVVDCLIKHGADLSLKNKQGHTADELWPKDSPFRKLSDELILLAKQDPCLNEERQKALLTLVFNKDTNLLTWEFLPNKVLSNFLSHALYFNNPNIINQLLTHKKWPEWSKFKTKDDYTLLHCMASINATEACRNVMRIIVADGRNEGNETSPLH